MRSSKTVIVFAVLAATLALVSAEDERPGPSFPSRLLERLRNFIPGLSGYPSHQEIGLDSTLRRATGADLANSTDSEALSVSPSTEQLVTGSSELDERSTTTSPLDGQPGEPNLEQQTRPRGPPPPRPPYGPHHSPHHGPRRPPRPEESQWLSEAEENLMIQQLRSILDSHANCCGEPSSSPELTSGGQARVMNRLQSMLTYFLPNFYRSNQRSIRDSLAGQSSGQASGLGFGQFWQGDNQRQSANNQGFGSGEARGFSQSFSRGQGQGFGMGFGLPNQNGASSFAMSGQ